MRRRASERFIGEEQIAEHSLNKVRDKVRANVEFPSFQSPHPSHQTRPIRQQYVIAAYG